MFPSVLESSMLWPCLKRFILECDRVLPILVVRDCAGGESGAGLQAALLSEAAAAAAIWEPCRHRSRSAKRWLEGDEGTGGGKGREGGGQGEEKGDTQPKRRDEKRREAKRGKVWAKEEVGLRRKP
eukprot:6183051-Pleurochrysis_carterae.AAC.4